MACIPNSTFKKRGFERDGLLLIAKVVMGDDRKGDYVSEEFCQRIRERLCP